MKSPPWYITLIAVYYFIICALTSIFYISRYFTPHDAGMIPWSSQCLCFAAAIVTAIYFINPRLGHRGLIAITLLTLFAIGEIDIHATRFHLAILVILLLPMLFNRQQETVADPKPSLLGKRS